MFLGSIMIKNDIGIIFLCYSDAAMDTDEGEKEVPAKKPKTDPVLVRQLQAKYSHAPFFIQFEC